MHFVATIVEAAYLFQFAEEQGIAYYNSIQNLIYRGDEESRNRHHRWFKQSCFVVGRDDFDPYWQDDRIDWAPQVEEMVRRYMTTHDIEVLVIVTGKDAYLVKPLTIPRTR
jgi:hypothetical protein